jgi:phosphomannomutase
MLPMMKKTMALLGGEISGHLAFADRYFGYDDGIYTACRTIELISRSGKKISEYFKDLPHYVSTPEFRIFAGEEQKFQAVEAIHSKLKETTDWDITNVDGLRVNTPKGWFLIRPSQTEPLVTGRVEGKTTEALSKLKQKVVELLSEEKVHLDWNNPIAKH